VSLTSLDDVSALVKTTLEGVSLQAVIDREEAYLASELRSPLTGIRTQKVWRPMARHCADASAILLLRPTDEIDELRDNGDVLDASDVRLLEGGTAVERVGYWTGPLVEVDYTPNDAANVVRVVVELCRLTLTETGFNSESVAGDYQYQRAGIKPATAIEIQMASRAALVRSLRPSLRSASVSGQPVWRVSSVSA
jgi:hypothetical protein